MPYRTLADLVLLLHLAFIVFVLFGGLLAFRWRRAPIVHLPAAAWGAAVEFFGWVCPLTPLESALRSAGGGTGYSVGFIEHRIVPLVYPAELTRNVQLVLGAIVVVVNVLVYTLLILRARRK
jgi:Protein of Unknown function (DUF2784)